MTRKLLLIAFICYLFAIEVFSQKNESYFLRHLTKDEYNAQIKKCYELAHNDMGLTPKNAIYTVDENHNSYDWLISKLNEVIDKHYGDVFIKEYKDEINLVTYNISWERDKKYVALYISVFLNDKFIDKTMVLYGIMNGEWVEPVKVNACKKEFKKILSREI